MFTLIEFISDSILPKHFVVHWIDTSSPIWYRRLRDYVIQNLEHGNKVSSLRSRFIDKFSGISSRQIRENSILRRLNRGSKFSRSIMSSTSQFWLLLLSFLSLFQCAFIKFNLDRSRLKRIYKWHKRHGNKSSPGTLVTPETEFLHFHFD